MVIPPGLECMKEECRMFRFVVLSVIGIFLYFAPVFNGNVPLVAIVGFLKKLLGATVMNYLVLLLCSSLLVTVFLAKVSKVEAFVKYHEEDGIGKISLYVLAVVFCIMLIFNIGPAQLLHKDVGGLAIYLAGSVMLTVIFAGWFVILILKSGIVEFVGVLIEPIMRPVFKLPGCVAQGIGYTLTEEMLYDENAKLLNKSFTDYKVPRSTDMCPIQSIIIEAYEPSGPFGAKSIGEMAIAPVPPAIANAVADAIGIRINELPYTKERVLAALSANKK